MSVLAAAAMAGEDTVQDFAVVDAGSPSVFRRRGKVEKKQPLKDGRAQMLFGRSWHKTSLGFARTAESPRRTVEASFTVTLSGQNEGFCFLLLHTGRFDDKGAAWDPQPTRKTPAGKLATPDWAEPNLRDSLAVAFDVRNPKDEDWFNENGNFYGRPEREVSVHWDGREIANVACTPELADGKPKKCRVTVEFVTGGAEVGVHVGDTAVLERRFIPHVLPYECRAAFGAHGAGEMFLDDVRVGFGPKAAPTPPPIIVPALRKAWIRPGAAATHAREVELLPKGAAMERVILSVTYGGPMARDYWDRGAAAYVWDDEGTRHELARLITPFMLFDTDYRYDIDVTDFAALLRGKRKLGVHVGTNVGRGFLVDATLTYYRRPDDVERRPQTMRIVPLWNGRAKFNQPGHVAKFFAPREIKVPEGTKRALVRITVTGHGVMEFTELSRTLTANGKAFPNLLWKTDCYLNPHRPQFGTWKFDRAGWCPGSAVEPWTIDVTDLGKPGGTLQLSYAPDEFTTKKWADHRVEAYIVFQK